MRVEDLVIQNYYLIVDYRGKVDKVRLEEVYYPHRETSLAYRRYCIFTTVRRERWSTRAYLNDEEVGSEVVEVTKLWNILYAS
jgi:hypothetical protein